MFERIVAAIDSDPDRSTRVEQAARELALACGSDVLVAHVLDVERSARMVAAAKPGVPPALHLESEEAARALVDGAVERLQSAGVRAGGEIGAGAGSTARELLEIGREFNASVIIVGARGAHMSDLLLGSVAHKIVHLAECPVLLVR